MASLGVKHGELGIFDANGCPASPATIQAAEKNVQVLRGGLRSVLLPLGLSLLQNAGVKRGETLILVLDNNRTSVACMLAAMHLQCICPVLSVGRVALLGLVKTQTEITRVVTVNDATESVEVQDDTNPQAAGDVLHELPTNSWLQDPEIVKSGCVCMLTSGSVGQPKVTACTWEHMLLQGESTHQQLFPNGPARIICGTSISHAYSINTLFALLTSPYDAQSELCFATNAVGLYALLAERSELFTALYATPGTYTALAAMPPTALYADVPYCAGTRLSLSLFCKMRDQYGLRLMQNYGSTEMGDMAAWYLHGKKFDEETKIMASNKKQLYVGSAWPGVDVRVENNGEVTMKTPWQSLGYVVEQVLHRFDDSAHHTSDLGIVTRDENGVSCVWLQGRLRPMVEVKWQGQSLSYSTGEIEGVIAAHQSVSDVLVLIQNEASRKRGVVQVRVVLENGATVKASDLKQWCSKHDFPALGDALQIEFAKFLPCSPAGKMMYT
ncbi:hypothetical protein PHYBOEH_010955 [Phytophthora boehmeriae]|uniref:AMP-dependent synthetase/ligase domain-containing protein n=1 Tax=Phytophthora boehmeriae TaxID=109152 RepID=A0A8T1X1Y5_9STRA|nr:hypothetical protein PHYBOEH_010955 [Phytophthora boehmeriae]